MLHLAQTIIADCLIGVMYVDRDLRVIVLPRRWSDDRHRRPPSSDGHRDHPLITVGAEHGQITVIDYPTITVGAAYATVCRAGSDDRN